MTTTSTADELILRPVVPCVAEYILPVEWHRDLLDLLSESRVEITNLDGPTNPVAVRLAAMERRLSDG